MVVRPTDMGLCFTTGQIVLPVFPLNTVISIPRNNQVKHFFGKKIQVQNHTSSFLALFSLPPGILRDLGGESGPDIYLLFALHEAWGGGVV